MIVPLPISFGLTADCLDGLFSICYGSVKKWASTQFYNEKLITNVLGIGVQVWEH